MIGLLLLISSTAWKGLENIVEGANRWTWAAMGLTAMTLLVALFSTCAGLLYGSWVDGLGWVPMVLALTLLLLVLVIALGWMKHRQTAQASA